MILATVIGVAFMASFFFIFALQLDEKEHNVLKNLLMMFAFSSILLIPNAIINQKVCEPLLQNTTTITDVTTYSYENYCYSPLTSAKGFLKAANLAYLVFIAYIIVYLGYKSLLWLYESVRRRG